MSVFVVQQSGWFIVYMYVNCSGVLCFFFLHVFHWFDRAHDRLLPQFHVSCILSKAPSQSTIVHTYKKARGHANCHTCGRKEDAPHVSNVNRLARHRMHACMNLFGVSVFKIFYLLNKKSDWKSVFTIKSLAMRSSKLDPMLICFDEFFFWLKSCHVDCMWIAIIFTLKLPWYVSAIFFYI